MLCTVEKKSNDSLPKRRIRLKSQGILKILRKEGMCSFYGTNHVLAIRKKGVLAESRVMRELLLKRMSRLQGSLLNGDSHLPSRCRERQAPSQKSV